MSCIILIDDDKDMLKMTERWLIKAGYEVFSEESGAAALERIRSLEPDLVILDYFMPEMDGPEILFSIRSEDRLKNIPVLFRTGMEDELPEDVQTRLQPGGVVSKAGGKAQLLKAVSDVLG
ncbi:MAG: response regulator [Lachnospiraceae bacterium]|nr:response regulator [Lachnospiraceae bacterium]